MNVGLYTKSELIAFRLIYLTCQIINKQNDQKFSHIINRFTKLDPTLPRINTIDCPNKDCQTNHDKQTEKEIIYIRYDVSNRPTIIYFS